jgi:hypothetical protein
MRASPLYRARSEWPRAGRRPFRAGFAGLLIVLQLAGCYQYVPVRGTELPIGSRVTVSVNDRGRIALAEPVGPGVRRIQGLLLANTDSAMAVSVSSVQYYDLAVPAVWAGERVELAPDHIAEVREWRLSRTRTWLAAGLLALGAAALTLVTISGLGGDDPGDRPTDPNGGTHQ